MFTSRLSCCRNIILPLSAPFSKGVPLKKSILRQGTHLFTVMDITAPAAQNEEPIVSRKRRICDGCGRPSNTCLCSAMPSPPISLAGHVIVIRHPNEKSKPLATIPILSRCLKDMTVLHGRKYKEGTDAGVDALLLAAARGDCPLYMLFPGKGATPLNELPPWTQQPLQPPPPQQQQHTAVVEVSSNDRGTTEEASNHTAAAAPSSEVGTSDMAPANEVEGDGSSAADASLSESGRTPAYVLLAVDGTWREAREMWRGVSSQMLQPQGCGIQVTLPVSQPVADASPFGQPPAAAGGGEQPVDPAGPTGGQSSGAGELDGAKIAEQGPVAGMTAGPCLIRTEPVEGYLTTYEALCKAVAILEGNSGLGEKLLEPLRLMTRYQAQHDPAVAGRCRWAIPEGSEAPVGTVGPRGRELKEGRRPSKAAQSNE